MSGIIFVIKRKSTAICVYDLEHHAELARHAYIFDKQLSEAKGGTP
jgi:hypothetical protein